MYKILLATDGSDHSVKATEYVKTLLQKIGDATVAVVSVADTGAMILSGSDMHGAYAIPVAGLEEAAQRDVQQAVALLAPAGKPIEKHVRVGNPADVICEIAAKGGFDVVVMGSRGHGAIAGVFLGSVSNKVIHRACAPVLVVR